MGEVISVVQRCRRWSAEQKLELVEEAGGPARMREGWPTGTG
jgi:transposase-like protein